MLLAVWIALALLVVVIVVGAVHVFLRARVFMRDAKVVSAEFEGPMRRLEASVDLLSAKAATAEARSARLDASVTRLQRSVARLEVLRNAIQETADSVRGVAAVYPRK